MLEKYNPRYPLGNINNSNENNLFIEIRIAKIFFTNGQIE